MIFKRWQLLFLLQQCLLLSVTQLCHGHSRLHAVWRRDGALVGVQLHCLLQQAELLHHFAQARSLALERICRCSRFFHQRGILLGHAVNVVDSLVQLRNAA